MTQYLTLIRHCDRARYGRQSNACRYPAVLVAFFALILLGFPVPATAQSEFGPKIHVGIADIRLPPLDGFQTLTGPSIKAFNVPETNRLQALYLIKSDVEIFAAEQEPVFDTYITIQTVEDRPRVFDQEFYRLKIQARSAFELKSVEPLKEADYSPNGKAQSIFAGLEEDQTKTLDIFCETEQTLCSLHVTRYGSSYLMKGLAIVHVKKIGLMLEIARNYAVPDDIEEIKALTGMLVEQVVANNPLGTDEYLLDRFLQVKASSSGPVLTGLLCVFGYLLFTLCLKPFRNRN